MLCLLSLIFLKKYIKSGLLNKRANANESKRLESTEALAKIEDQTQDQKDLYSI